MNRDDFEERLSNLKKIYKLTSKEKSFIMKRILKKEKVFSFIYLIPIFILLFLIIYLLPHQTPFLAPNFILDESEGIKRIETFIELYFSNPLFLSQIIYYLFFLLSIVFAFVFIKVRFNIKGGK